MAIPFAITGMLTFYTPNLGPSGKLIYAYITYTLVMMAYTAINIPYGALMGVISSNSLERTSVSTYRFIAAFCGGIIVQYCTLGMVRWFGGGIRPKWLTASRRRLSSTNRPASFGRWSCSRSLP